MTKMPTPESNFHTVPMSNLIAWYRNAIKHEDSADPMTKLGARLIAAAAVVEMARRKEEK